MKGLLDTQMEMLSSSGYVSLEGRGEVHVEVVVEKAETGCSHLEAWGSLERTCIASLALTDLDRLLTDPCDPTFFFFSTNLSQFGTSFTNFSCTSPSPLPVSERGKKVNFPEALLGRREAIVPKQDPPFACETEPVEGASVPSSRG